MVNRYKERTLELLGHPDILRGSNGYLSANLRASIIVNRHRRQVPMLSLEYRSALQVRTYYGNAVGSKNKNGKNVLRVDTGPQQIKFNSSLEVTCPRKGRRGSGCALS